MTRIVLFISIISAGLLLSAETTLPKHYLESADKIDKAIAAERWTDAESLLIDALRSDPTHEANWMLISNLGMIQYYQGKDSAALATLNEGLRIRPDAVTLLSNRARVFSSTGRSDKALDDYNRIIEIDSINGEAYLNRGLMNLYFGDLKQAETDIERSCILMPESAESWLAMATLKTILNQPREAIPYYNKLINASPSPEYYAARAFCFVVTDALPDAAEDIALGLEIDENYAELYLCRAMLNKRRFENDRALADAQRAINLGADSKRVKQILGL